MKSLYERFTEGYDSQRRKHGFPDDHLEFAVNRLSQHEFLRQLSEELTEMFIEHATQSTIS